jgi:hypothetical protein
VNPTASRSRRRCAPNGAVHSPAMPVPSSDVAPDADWGGA